MANVNVCCITVSSGILVTLSYGWHVRLSVCHILVLTNLMTIRPSIMGFSSLHSSATLVFSLPTFMPLVQVESRGQTVKGENGENMQILNK